jgi:radical SAM-linked protein
MAHHDPPWPSGAALPVPAGPSAGQPRPMPPGPPGPPVAQRLAIRYAKRRRMRFASHRDVARAFERGVRKADLPVAYSSGFSPHPKISYSGGAPTGAASEAEYLELALTEPRAPAEVQERLDAALPDGIDVIEVTELEAQRGGLRLEASLWQVVLPGITPAAAEAAVAAFLAAPTAVVVRLTGKGRRELDARAAVVMAEVDRRADEDGYAGCAILRMVVRQMTPAVRPDDILAALRDAAALAPPTPPLVTRLAQGPLEAVAAVAAADAAAQQPQPVWPGVAQGQQEVAQAPVPPRRGAAQGQEHVAQPGPARPGAPSGQEQATRLEAGDADAACAAPVSAYELLPRGAEGPDQDLSARETDGRDSPDARHRAIRRRVRT